MCIYWRKGLIETCIVYMVSEVEPKGPSITILGAITKDGVIAF